MHSNNLFGFIVLLGLLFAASTNAHTYLSSLTIDGTAYKEGDCVRPHPGSQYDYPINQINRPTGLQSADMTCGWLPAAANKANKKCPVNPGSSVTFQWHYEMGLGTSDTFIIDPSHHGPCIVYMAKSDTGAGAVWFKIFQDGYNATASSTLPWCVDRMRANGGKFTVKIPTDITPGNYLIRAELIALHEGFELNGAQPYLHCAEITVGGSGTVNPGNLVAFPGAYKNTDAGIYFDIYTQSGNGVPIRGTYPIPGPALYVSGSAPSPSPSTPTTGRSTTGKPATPTTGRSTTGKPATPTTGRAAATTGRRSTTGKSTTGANSVMTTAMVNTQMCYVPGTPNLNGKINTNPPYCGDNSRKARCADGQCCSKYGYCGPRVDSQGRYYELIDDEYQYVTKEVAIALYCNDDSSADYRKVPCDSIDKREEMLVNPQEEAANPKEVVSTSFSNSIRASITILIASLLFATSF